MCRELPVVGAIALLERSERADDGENTLSDWSKKLTQRQRRFHPLLLQRKSHLFRN
jgi:hypothetical protein